MQQCDDAIASGNFIGEKKTEASQHCDLRFAISHRGRSNGAISHRRRSNGCGEGS